MKIRLFASGALAFGGIARRLMRTGRRCVVFDTDAATRDGLAKKGAAAAGSLTEVVSALGKSRMRFG